MANAVGGRSIGTNGVDDVLSVGPHLHEAGGEEGLRSHGGAVPLDSVGVGEASAGHGQQLTIRPPGGSEFIGGKVAPRAQLELVECFISAAARRYERVDGGSKCLGIDDRQRGVAIEVGQVGELVCDRPARAWRWQRHLSCRQRRDDGIQRPLFGEQVSNYFGYIHG